MTRCSHCEEERHSRCSYSDCPFDVDRSAETITSLQQQLSDCKSSLRAAEQNCKDFNEAGLAIATERDDLRRQVEFWRRLADSNNDDADEYKARAEKAESSLRAVEAEREAELGIKERWRTLAYQHEQTILDLRGQVRAALERALEFLDEIGSTTTEQWGRLNPRLISGSARVIAKSVRALASKEGGNA